MLRNPEDVPSVCYLPSHPPGRPRAAKPLVLKCASHPGGGRQAVQGPAGDGDRDGDGAPFPSLSARTSESREEPTKPASAAAGSCWAAGALPRCQGREGLGGPAGAGGGGQASSIPGIDPVPPGEGLSFGQRARHQCARKVTDHRTCERKMLSLEKAGPSRRSPAVWPRLSSEATCPGWRGTPHSCMEERGCPGKRRWPSAWRDEARAGAEEASPGCLCTGCCPMY